MIIVRTLRRDIARYNRMDDEVSLSCSDKFTWIGQLAIFFTFMETL